MVEVKRKKGETFESFLRRFNKRLLQSGKIFQARKIRFYHRPINKNKIKRDALRRESIKEKKEYLRKIGRLKDEF